MKKIKKWKHNNSFFIAEQNCHSDWRYNGLEQSTYYTEEYCAINKGVYRRLRFLVQKINEASTGKNKQTVSLKLLIFRFYSITIYFADIKFPNMDLMTTQAFGFSKFKMQTPKSSS